MADNRVDSSTIRNRAFALALLSCPPPNRLLILASATEYRQYILECIRLTSTKAILVRLIAALIECRLFREWLLIYGRLKIVRLVANQEIDTASLQAAIHSEIERRRYILLGPSNTPAAITILAKVAQQPEIHRQLMKSLREGRSEIVSGKVVVRLRNQIAAIAVIFAVILGWLTLVVSSNPTILNSWETFVIFVVSAFLFLTYLLWPIIKLARSDFKMQQSVNLERCVR